MLAYINESLKADKIKGLEDDALETLWQQINPHKSKRPILVGAVHRPPSRTAAVDTALELNIEAAYLRKQEMYLLGDLNINYLDTATYQNHRLIRALKSLSLSQVISSVTRPMSSTCLDHLYTTFIYYLLLLISQCQTSECQITFLYFSGGNTPGINVMEQINLSNIEIIKT